MLRLLPAASALLLFVAANRAPTRMANTASASIQCTHHLPEDYWTPTYQDASFTIATRQIVTWTASYGFDGSPADVGSCNPNRKSFYLSTHSPAGFEIELTSTGATSGSKLLDPGTYYIGIESGWMGPGSYAVTYNHSAVISVSPTSWDFGAVLTGSSTSSHTFNITNAGDLPLNITSVTSSDAAHFPVTFTPGLAPRSFTAQFVAGSAAGAYASTITVAGSNPDVAVAPVTVSVSGGALTPTPNIYCAGPTDLGSADYSIGASLVANPAYGNNGSATLVVSNVTVENDDPAAAVFSADGVPSTAPLNGGTRGVGVRFTPLPSGGERTYYGRLRISSNDPDEPVKQCAFHARGHHPVPRLIVSPASLDYGSVPIGIGRTRSIRMSNGGDAPLQVMLTDAWTGNPAYEPNRPQWSSVPTGITRDVAPGQSSFFDVRYAPNAAGTHAIAIGIQSNDPVSPMTQIIAQGSARVSGPMRVVLVYDRARSVPVSFRWQSFADALSQRAVLLLLDALRDNSETFGAVSTAGGAEFAGMRPLTHATRVSDRSALVHAPARMGAPDFAGAFTTAQTMLAGTGQPILVIVTNGALDPARASRLERAARAIRVRYPSLRTYAVIVGAPLGGASDATLRASGLFTGIQSFTPTTDQWTLTSFYLGMYP